MGIRIKEEPQNIYSVAALTAGAKFSQRGKTAVIKRSQIIYIRAGLCLSQVKNENNNKKIT